MTREPTTQYPHGIPNTGARVTVTEVYEGTYEHGNDQSAPQAEFILHGRGTDPRTRTSRGFLPSLFDGSRTLVTRVVAVSGVDGPLPPGATETPTSPKLEIHYDSEDTGGSGTWAALYVNGLLETVGDAYVAEEKALKLAGIRTVQDSAFMRGQNQRAGVANTLDEVREYRDQRDALLADAAALEQQAAALREQASTMRQQAGQKT